MSFSLVGSLGAVHVTGTNVANTPAYGQTPTAGNLLLCWVVGFVGTTTPTTPANWTSVATVLLCWMVRTGA